MSDTNKALNFVTVVPFLDFIKTKDDNEQVDHSKGWHSCAIGDYTRFSGIDTLGLTDVIDTRHEPACISALREVYLPEAMRKAARGDAVGGGYSDGYSDCYYDVLNNARLDKEWLLEEFGIDIETYGGLKELAEACEGEV